jgi:phosphate/sulfate permease
MIKFSILLLSWGTAMVSLASNNDLMGWILSPLLAFCIAYAGMMILVVDPKRKEADE